MTASAERLASYVSDYVSAWHAYPGYSFMDSYASVPVPRPSVDELAEALLQDAQFLELNLGTFLQTDRGQLIAAAMEQVSPGLYRDDEKLIVEALTQAARMQAAGKLEQAKPLLVAAGVGMVLLIMRVFGS